MWSSRRALCCPQTLRDYGTSSQTARDGSCRRSKICNSGSWEQPCGAQAQCIASNCRLCHSSARFRTHSGRRVLAQPHERWCLQKLQRGEISGELFDEPGAESTQVFLMHPSMPERERWSVVRDFNRMCELDSRSLFLLMRQAGKRSMQNSFLRI